MQIKINDKFNVQRGYIYIYAAVITLKQKHAKL